MCTVPGLSALCIKSHHIRGKVWASAGILGALRPCIASIFVVAFAISPFIFSFSFSARRTSSSPSFHFAHVFDRSYVDGYLVLCAGSGYPREQGHGVMGLRS